MGEGDNHIMWNQTLGHSQQISQLRNLVETGKLPHALLLTGIRGIGKTRVATGLAQALNCEGTQKPCETCTSCQKIAGKIHPDIHWIEPAEDKTVISIEAIRKIQSTLQLHPLEGQAKCACIEPADSMTLAAANALLKILEEPPANTYFILITDKPFELPATIRSRCQQVALAPLAKAILQKRLGSTTLGSDAVARLAQGSLQKALTWDPAFAESVFRQMESVWELPTPTRILTIAEQWSSDETRIPKILEMLACLWHDALVDGTATDERLIFPEARIIREHLAKLGPDKLWDRWQKLLQAPHDLERYANKQLLMENLLFQLTQN